MRIQHNAAVLNSHNNIMKTANKMQKTSEKLLSGYKINGVADSGLAQINNPNLIRMRELAVQGRRMTR